jgi:hypothetical protein
MHISWLKVAGVPLGIGRHERATVGEHEAHQLLMKRLFPIIALLLFNGLFVHADTINISGSVIGTASVDFAGRCAPLPTVNATGNGVASGLGNFFDTQSHCTTGPLSFDQGIFDLTSTDIPENSLLGTYFGMASSQDGLLEFTSTLLVTGGTGIFDNASGTLLSSGSLNENTGAFQASFSGSAGAVPEPSSISLIGLGITAFWLIRRKSLSVKVNL